MQVNNRYKIDTFKAQSLVGNPLNSPIERDLNIYLPPGYYQNEDKRYPVIYFLNGYGGDNQNWVITKNLKDKDFILPLKLIPRKLRTQINFDRIFTFETIDNLIINKELEPFILVQPDPSLHVPQKDLKFGLKGSIPTKGSFYVNSPHTGNYMDYIIKDIINYIDSNYRTIPDKEHRAIFGGSMGGFGTFYLCLHHPELFSSAVALSPGNFTLELVELNLKSPILEKIVGEEIATNMEKLMSEDIMDTLDLIASKDNPIASSVKRDENGKILEMNMDIWKKWQKYDINYIIRDKPNSLKQVNLMLNCEIDDEYGLNTVAEKIHETLLEFDIEHQFEMYSDPEAALSPHYFGMIFHFLTSIRFCLKHFKK